MPEIGIFHIAIVLLGTCTFWFNFTRPAKHEYIEKLKERNKVYWGKRSAEDRQIKAEVTLQSEVKHLRQRGLLFGDNPICCPNCTVPMLKVECNFVYDHGNLVLGHSCRICKCFSLWREKGAAKPEKTFADEGVSINLNLEYQPDGEISGELIGFTYDDYVCYCSETPLENKDIL